MTIEKEGRRHQHQLGKMAGLVLNSTAVLRLNFCILAEHFGFGFRHFAKLKTGIVEQPTPKQTLN